MAVQNLRTAKFSEEARKRLGKAVGQARRAIGHRYRPSFAALAGVSVRSLEAVERGEPTVGVSVLEDVGRTLGRHIRGWGVGTAEVILEGGPIPEHDLLDPEEPRKAQQDALWGRARRELAALIRSGVDAETYLRRLDHWHGRLQDAGFTDADLLNLSAQAQSDKE